MKSFRVHAFQLQKADFFVEASGIPCETAVCSHNPVTGNDDGNGIVSYGSAYGLSGHAFFMEGAGGKRGERLVCDGFAVGNAAEFLPDELPERTSRRGERQFGR